MSRRRMLILAIVKESGVDTLAVDNSNNESILDSNENDVNETESSTQ